jgi:hypothetical protein
MLSRRYRSLLTQAYTNVIRGEKQEKADINTNIQKKYLNKANSNELLLDDQEKVINDMLIDHTDNRHICLLGI